LEIEREALVHLDAAGGEGAGLHDEETDLHWSALSAHDRGRGNDRARPQHALQNGAAVDIHAWLPPSSSMRGWVLSPRVAVLRPTVILAYRDKLVAPPGCGPWSVLINFP